jgi:hypothetical protein
LDDPREAAHAVVLAERLQAIAKYPWWRFSPRFFAVAGGLIVLFWVLSGIGGLLQAAGFLAGALGFSIVRHRSLQKKEARLTEAAAKNRESDASSRN